MQRRRGEPDLGGVCELDEASTTLYGTSFTRPPLSSEWIRMALTDGCRGQADVVPFRVLSRAASFRANFVCTNKVHVKVHNCYNFRVIIVASGRAS